MSARTRPTLRGLPRIAIFAGLLACILYLAGCAGIAGRDEHATRLARSADMDKLEIETNPFRLRGFVRILEADQPTRLYIEGDGLAWISRYQPSANPTPTDPVGLRLAIRDPHPNVIYLARPCQYVQPAEQGPCMDDRYWTSHRFAPEVISAYDQALDQLETRYAIPSFEIVGFSGGGTAAALIAARRGDILNLRSVAGNMDIDAHSEYHEISKLYGSLNPADFGDDLTNLPQIHFVGEEDGIVPPAVIDSYHNALRHPACSRAKLVLDTAHEGPWASKWPSLLDQAPNCKMSLSIEADKRIRH